MAEYTFMDFKLCNYFKILQTNKRSTILPRWVSVFAVLRHSETWYCKRRIERTTNKSSLQCFWWFLLRQPFLCRYFHFIGDHLSFIYYGYRRKSMLTLQFTEWSEIQRRNKSLGRIIIIFLLIFALYWRQTRFCVAPTGSVSRSSRCLFCFLTFFFQFAVKTGVVAWNCDSVVSRGCWTPSAVTFHSLYAKPLRQNVNESHSLIVMIDFCFLFFLQKRHTSDTKFSTMPNL